VRVDNNPFLEMWLRLQKLAQRYSEPFFFLINKTGTSCGDEIGKMKPVLRFFSMNFLRVCLDTKIKYIRPTGG